MSKPTAARQSAGCVKSFQVPEPPSVPITAMAGFFFARDPSALRGDDGVLAKFRWQVLAAVLAASKVVAVAA